MSGFFSFGCRRSSEDGSNPEIPHQTVEDKGEENIPEIMHREADTDGAEETEVSRLVSPVSPTARAMTPVLPGVDADVMPEQGASFDDRVLLLLAAVAQSEGMLT